MKQVLMAMAMTIFAYTSVEAQTKCETTAPVHRTAVKHKRQTASRTTACRMIPYQVCTIQSDRRSVSCYMTTDSADQTKTGRTTFYGPTGPMPGEVVKFKVRTIVIKGENKGSYCKRNKAGDETICYQPGGYLIRDENGYYSYGEAVPKNVSRRVAVK